ncbi:insulinase family protein [candidate division WOR-3 bacterium]|nr:insulinase family protein [candidate division WOR-3 bacterium]
MLATALCCLLLALPADDFESRVHEFDLANGLHCIVYVDSAAPVVSVNSYYKVGSYYEPPGNSGLSHMLEHMTFKRTDVYQPGDFDRILDSVGARNNGFTSTFYTGYYEDFASDRWDLGLKLEAARMGRCLFPDSDFESEHQVVWEERRLHDNNPNSLFWEMFDATFYLANPQRNPTIGWSDDVARFTVEDVREWYGRYYNPANAVLVVAGAVDPADVQARVRRYFGRLKGTPPPPFDAYGVEPEQLGERRFRVHRRVSQPVLLVGFHSPGFRDSLSVAGDVAAGILGQGRSSRLYRRLVTETGLCAWAGAWSSVERDPAGLYVYVRPKQESDLPRIEEIVHEELARLCDSLAADRELERVRNGALADQVFNREDASDIAYFLATHQITRGDWRAFRRYPEELSAVTAEQVREFARTYLKADNRTVGLLLPVREEGQ